MLPSGYRDSGTQNSKKRNVLTSYQLFLLAKLETWNKRTALATDSFFTDLFKAQYYLCPFKGIYYLFCSSIYWNEAMMIFLVYMSKFLLFTFLYYFTVFPFVLGINTVLFGPLGITVAVVHSLMHVNLYATSVTRVGCLGHVAAILEKLFADKKAPTELARRIHQPAHHEVLEKRDWTQSLSMFAAKTTILFVVFSILFCVSLVPIIGIVLVKLLRSGSIGYDYFFFHLIRPKAFGKRSRDVFYREIGKFIAFGIVSGALELIPILSGITVTSNFLGSGICVLEQSQLLENSSLSSI
ncbi:LAQU0S01e14334g1_1 [Lachancea quebecensis]|uniref:LAQU0S01e14334g1_1 n=1 Tax=Lachancea quebecensis TaxID=1654605 RepID=A0A0P1KMY8_9SACH|nr:LAQU0S01e14334g1_1 [Lachancea quebecensis]